jgi:glycerol transport system ATP-binding protein
MLDLQGSLNRRASGLTADGKQKISLGRGLVRPDVNVIMFDEPLTVIDPHLKWLLRSKLKELHQQVGVTMIYVTHDQTEALTFADKVVVMHEGVVVQIGTPVELFERPNHTFVGHFIGSPGMNLLACDLREGKPTIDGHPLEVSAPFAPPDTSVQLQIGIRPEFVKFSREGLAVEIVKVNDVGRYRIVEARYQRQAIKLVVPEDEAIPADRAHILFDPAHTHLYADHWILT